MKPCLLQKVDKLNLLVAGQTKKGINFRCFPILAGENSLPFSFEINYGTFTRIALPKSG